MKHINIVKLKVVTFAILTSTKIFSQAKIIHLQMDNGNLGFLLANMAMFTVEHLPGTLNVEADHQSWSVTDSSK